MRAMMRLKTLWTSPIRLIVMVLVGLAILAAAFVTLAVVLPLLLIGGAILHFYVRRQLRRARPSASKHVIDVEYRVVDRP
jgi:Flp pilus assembly protein TadB